MKKIGTFILTAALAVSCSFAWHPGNTLSDEELSAVTGKGGKGGGGGGSTYTPPVDPDGLTSWEFMDKLANDAIYYWNGVDFSYSNPTGYSDSDYDGQTDANDAVVLIETMKNMGYDVPETTIDGLYYNYYTQAGYNLDMEDYYTKVDFDYTRTNSVDEQDLKNGDFWLLSQGDLIFIDYDKNFSWDNAALFVGYQAGYSYSVLIASDYYDKVMLYDLSDEYGITNMDIAYGYSDSKVVDYSSIEDYF